ncbi:hypothetical protein CVT26_003101 [Gymnopilus dilepis]|uniref:Uncharacterized protein n=1 Tax=Gymnopilus dilepis TaxID=231916 RepID=A0A409Y4X1_9AGAR|nr:hypothetical protein CVT26_003101 [Gymnopilus dilepis]
MPASLDAHRTINRHKRSLEAGIQRCIPELESMPSTIEDGGFEADIDVIQEDNPEPDEENDSSIATPLETLKPYDALIDSNTTAHGKLRALIELKFLRVSALTIEQLEQLGGHLHVAEYPRSTTPSSGYGRTQSSSSSYPSATLPFPSFRPRTSPRLHYCAYAFYTGPLEKSTRRADGESRHHNHVTPFPDLSRICPPHMDPTAQSRRSAPDARASELSVLLHGMLFISIQLDDFRPTLVRIIKWLEIEEHEWITKGVSSGLEYGRANGLLRRLGCIGPKKVNGRQVAAAMRVMAKKESRAWFFRRQGNNADRCRRGAQGRSAPMKSLTVSSADADSSGDANLITDHPFALMFAPIDLCRANARPPPLNAQSFAGDERPHNGSSSTSSSSPSSSRLGTVEGFTWKGETRKRPVEGEPAQKLERWEEEIERGEVDRRWMVKGESEEGDENDLGDVTALEVSRILISRFAFSFYCIPYYLYSATTGPLTYLWVGNAHPSAKDWHVGHYGALVASTSPSEEWSAGLQLKDKFHLLERMTNL